MKLTTKVKLNPTPEQADYLLQTLERANAACDFVSKVAWERKVFGSYALQKIIYSAVREKFDLAAQMTVRLLSKVGDAYKLDKKSLRTFRKHGAIAYDDRILRWYTDKRRVSIWSVGGRLNIPYQAGERQHELLKTQQGESDLLYYKGSFYLLATCDIPDPDERDTENALGVDLGVTNIATTSDGDVMTNEAVEKNRKKHHRLRRNLQKANTRSARRHLRKLAGKQARFQKDTNHRISKQLVACAVHTKRAIAVEDLTGIRTRTRVRGADNRAKHGNWSFAQLREYIGYKAALAGIPVVVVDPAYTSRGHVCPCCFVCGHTERANRRTQACFACVQCGHTAQADVNAANNIAWAAVMQPKVARPTLGTRSPRP